VLEGDRSPVDLCWRAGCGSFEVDADLAVADADTAAETAVGGECFKDVFEERGFQVGGAA